MEYYQKPVRSIIAAYNSDKTKGLTQEKLMASYKKYGRNVITKKKEKSIVKRLIEALLEPMMLILSVAFIITLGVNIGREIKNGSGEFYECIGILVAIMISTVLTVVMESKSEKAFSMLKKMGDNQAVKVLRNGEVQIVKNEEIAVGDIVYLEAGNRIPADGRIITANEFCVDESTMTGESVAVKKDERVVFDKTLPLAERINCVFSGTYVTAGNCTYIVTAVGDNAEIGKIAVDISSEKTISAPLYEKLSRLGKMVSIFGIVSSVFVFALSLVRLILAGNVSFNSVQDIFIESIVLIVAAVPEGLPTTVAISLTLNVLRLAKSNALIRKLVATETVGCVSVICSDKTGTLTKNKMSLVKIVSDSCVYPADKIKNNAIIYNIAVNSSAEITGEGSSPKYIGSATECALLEGLKTSGIDYKKIRKSGAISLKTAFSSQIKYMETEHFIAGKRTLYIKGAPEVVLKKCLLSEKETYGILREISAEQKRGGRVIAFASSTGGTYRYDGFGVIADSLRDDVKESIESCKNAGIAVKMLTGDNLETARSIAIEAGLSAYGEEVVSADYIESLTDGELTERLPHITVIARSTPHTKLKVVSCLQNMGEVVAVTGDGVNDAPAIKHADIGIAMGDGCEITKQASDIVLLDNSFSTILKAITFGRNVYSNFQRFIMFQLTVNLASMCIIIASLLLGLESPFSSTCLLWLNIIMDGPLALSLGLEMRSERFLRRKPVKRSADILNTRILVRIGLHAAVMCIAVSMQRFFNFIGCREEEQATVVITMFVFFQIFNAINCREVTSESVFKDFFGNKLLLGMILITYILHILIVTFVPGFFGTVRLSLLMWIKITLVCALIVGFSEAYKLIYRLITKAKTIKRFSPEFSINEKRQVT